MRKSLKHGAQLFMLGVEVGTQCMIAKVWGRKLGMCLTGVGTIPLLLLPPIFLLQQTVVI